jgi:hypothetical protein
MARVTHHRQLNTAGLEADVMRFMAIIAFCLIAMMALVKDVEPKIEMEPESAEAESATPETPEVAAEAEAPPAPEPDPEPAPHDPAKQIIVTKVIVQKEPVSEISDVKVPDVKPPVSRSATTKTPRAAVAVPPEPIPDVPIAKVQSTPITVKEQGVAEGLTEEQTPHEPEPEPETLTFRFDSDRTFLHLIATDRLQLYAHTAQGFLAMDDRFNIIESRPSGELFEVMAQSIPLKIKSIFNRINTSPVYLVALPAETRRDLNKFLGAKGENSTTGVLIIHRNGRISHEI